MFNVVTGDCMHAFYLKKKSQIIFKIQRSPSKRSLTVCNGITITSASVTFVNGDACKDK